jgi:hypothetical protein
MRNMNTSRTKAKKEMKKKGRRGNGGENIEEKRRNESIEKSEEMAYRNVKSMKI